MQFADVAGALDVVHDSLSELVARVLTRRALQSMWAGTGTGSPPGSDPWPASSSGAGST
jgi:hypothetical protein